ncbi:DUF6752 domain-containing protein [Modestobacter excelsi]|uniref:DUF6752 domain-containing protein n=1 Tax=Modestobacter excelsi TaxID=2213161 RepID=UPI00110D063B|nr:DUF6752 domain-containing protein [Modestobacter excelsi]
MAATSLRQALGGPVRLVRGRLRLGTRLRERIVPEMDELLRSNAELRADRDRLFTELRLAFESVTAAHQGIADLQTEQRALRERLDTTLRLAESAPPRLDVLEDGLHEARRLNLRIAELTDVVAEVVLPLHDRDIDPAAIDRLRADTL